jgi:hypothetical protein
MLHYLYFSRLRNEPDGIGGIRAVIDDRPLSPDTKFWIRQYSNVGIYYLVGWAMGPKDIDEYATGENLWRDKTPIAYGGGFLPLYTPKDPNGRIDPTTKSIWNRIEANAGAFGVPDDVAIALRDPANIVYF